MTPQRAPVPEHGPGMTFVRRDVQALDGIDLRLAKGSFSSVIGSRRHWVSFW